MVTKKTNSMDKIVSLCKRRGFIFPGSEIYGGLASTYDYGPLGVELKNNIKKIWWKMFVQDRDDMVGLDGGILMSSRVWEASGHVSSFKDPLKECRKCHARFRPDKVANPNVCPQCESEDLTDEKMFLGMFKTTIGPVEEEGETVFIRPETAQAIFANYKNVLQSTNKKIPFGIGQIGKAFRNEITTGNFIFRTLEFEQMEIEYFISPQEKWEKIFDRWHESMYEFGQVVGIDVKKMHDFNVPKNDLAHYSKKTTDIEFEFPFGQDELWGLAYRTDHDLKSHEKHSGEDLHYFDEESKTKFLPHVIEPSFGLDRTLLAILTSAYEEQDLGEGEIRTVLHLSSTVAPYKVAVFPLLKNKQDLVVKAREIYDKLKVNYSVFWDDRGNIGKRYRYQDEIGTPYCVTVDFDTLEKDSCVTVRDRDTMKQERIPINDLEQYLAQKM